jgi:hypothetical protein
MNTPKKQGNSEIFLHREYSGLSTRYLVGLPDDKLLPTFRKTVVPSSSGLSRPVSLHHHNNGGQK